MQKLFRLTPLQDSYACNFNILIHGVPRVMGVREILQEWVTFREGCVKRRVQFDLNKKQEKLHLLEGLSKILLDIDKAIQIIRETEEESAVVPNLMIGFGMDEIQAEYVAEIKLRHLNREYILNRLQEIDQLRADIAEMQQILSSSQKIQRLIIQELKAVVKQYGQPRKTMFYYASDVEEADPLDDTPDYPVHLFLSESGYFKKISPASLRMNSEQKLKEEDQILLHLESTNRTELIFLTNQQQAYKTRVSAFDDTKASALGDYVPAKLSFDDGEFPIAMVQTTDYSGYLLFVFENGKAAKVPLSAYATKTNRKKLARAFNDKAPLVAALFLPEDGEVLLRSDGNRAVLLHTELAAPKATRDTQGVQVMTLKAKHKVIEATVLTPEQAEELKKYRVKSIPATGCLAKTLPDVGQMTL